MIKLSRREKGFLKWVAAVLVAALMVKVHDVYSERKAELQNDIEIKRSEITEFMNKLENESPKRYLDRAEAIEEDLAEAQGNILELPRESDASLLVRQTISEIAEQSGVTINAISSRKSKVVSKGTGLMVLRTYFGYDAELEPLLQFFETLKNTPYFVAIDNLNITARRKPKRTKRRTRRQPKASLNGNAVLATIFLPNPNGSLDQYTMKKVSSAVLEPEPGDEASEEPTEIAAAGSLSSTPKQTQASKPKESEPPPAKKPMGRELASRELEKKMDETVFIRKTDPKPDLQEKPRPLTDTAKSTKIKNKMRL